ncbi:MAG TPA: segregation/condensation protein A [Candidatus Baltobacteraceae bacterium]|jgi:segregation and condensation protein A|nr:segregation/condensation protein A [Candidatus Baltobacteraceae bacterium]
MTTDIDSSRTLRVQLEVFEGPLDLLLHLVKEQKLDIATVPLAAVAQQYFEYVALMEQLDVELAAEYLVIAATLVFLKSRSLLPPIPTDLLPEGEETPEEVEERLRARLIAYSQYKAVSEEFRRRSVEAASFFYREAGDPATEIVQRYQIEPGKLANALLAALRNAKPERRTIVRERISIAAQMDFITRSIDEHGEIEFLELCASLSRALIIATFMAVLELLRQHRIAFEQSAPKEPLLLLPFIPGKVYAN